MASGVTDVIEIVVLAPGPNALLRGNRAAVGPLLEPRKYVFELHHPRIGEHQRGIVARDERRGGNDFMPLLGKIVEKSRSNFVYAAHHRLTPHPPLQAANAVAPDGRTPPPDCTAKL